MEIEARKLEEIEFHNRREAIRSSDPEAYKSYYTNKKFYSVVRKSRRYVEEWCQRRVVGKRVLDYCCGLGDTSRMLARLGASEVVGIDISDESVRTAERLARERGLGDKCRFHVMDAENTSFPDHSFDYALCVGVLHHLDVGEAYRELSRVLRAGGQVLCGEPLAYNPLIQWYRKRTPHLRTKWESEHILTKKDIFRAKEYFESVDLRFFHLATIAAVPFRNWSRIFTAILTGLEMVDEAVLRLPLLRWQAWQIYYTLSHPCKGLLPS